jgi:methionine aminopeptidase
MCHGIPDSLILKSGDIITIDVTLYFDGFHGDTARTFFVGRYNFLIKIEIASSNNLAIMMFINHCYC